MQQSQLALPETVEVYRPKPSRVRARMHRILGEARRGQVRDTKRSLYQTIVPQMAQWLGLEGEVMAADILEAIAENNGEHYG